MEVELVTEEGMLEEDNFGVDDNNTDYSNFEAERCGICMDIVVDRGVLDCCQHCWNYLRIECYICPADDILLPIGCHSRRVMSKWKKFCFTCIDNWATITNLCPLCQNEFQLITCVPVYDTIGSNNADEDLESRDDDWCIEGKNNTLSFPSYYIDENAVVCLDGDGCKVQSMSESIEEYSNLDTSIACDSCDLVVYATGKPSIVSAVLDHHKVKYHAFCVGFDPEATCENSWLCPRCTVNLMPQKSDELPVLRPSNQQDPENSSGECFVDAAFSGKVMISVADDGETAVVVSMLEGKQWTEEQNQKISSLDVCKDPKIDTIETATVKENKGTEKPTLEAPFQVSESVSDAGEKVAIEGNEGTEEGRRKFFSSFSVSKDLKTDTSILSSFANNHKLETPSNERLSIEANSMAEELELSLSQGTSFTSPSNSLLSTELKTGFVDKARSTPSVSDGFGTSSNKLFSQLYNNESLESGLDLHLGLSVSHSLSVDKTNNKLAEDQVAVGVQLKNNLGECPLPADETIIDKKKNIDGISGAKRKHRDWRGAEDGEIKAKIGSKVLSKKVDADGNNQLVHSRNQVDECVLEDALKSPTVSKDRKLRGKSERKNVTTSIMDIVQGTERRPKGLPQASLAETSSGKRENAAGLRVKKIMRRPTEDKESSILVQKLRKEIRDAVRNKTSKELGDNLFDPKLLAAFRAAVAGPIAETKKSLPVDLKAKKSLLQKGKVRESLTKKIYGIGGRRRRAWNRDCEIEFWKYRCLKFSRPEKIETLNSVLNLLRKSSESTEINQGNEKAASNSILSRLYLADSSVFPRKDDIKPLSTLKAVGISGQNKEVSSTEKAFRQSLGNDFSKTPCTNAIPSQINTPIFSEVTKRTFPMVKGEASSSKLHSNRCVEGPTISKLGGSKSNSQKEIVGKSDDNKADKRKWAQQFLARKVAVTGKDASQEQEDAAVLKGNHTLLAQLPRDMRPVLAISRHNKIPTSIRQAQLHRLTEHFLRKANMPVNRRTAEIELAVADAVNIEKEVADRSNSKLVYVNLCSQELLHRSDTISSGRATKLDANPTSKVPTDRSVEATDDRSSCLEVDEALRNAGLLSDSPPNSPHHQMEEIEEVNTSKMLEQEGPDNVFEMDSQPELDIYGDFEYDLEDEDFIGASALKLSELQPGEPKLKVVFSTIDSDRSNGAQDFEDHEEPTIVEEPEGSSNLLGSLTNSSSGRSNVNDKTDNCDPQSSSLDEGGEELSLAECEELYGPDKEPLMKKFPERASMKPDEPKNSEDNGSNHTLKASDLDRETCAENLAIPTVVRHSSGGEDEPSQSQKNTSRKEKMHKMDIRKKNDGCNSSVYKKVEAYIKEHIRPLCKSGIITVEQYRWAVGKTTDKIMKHHSKDTNANFLIKEGEKVKKLAEQYVEAAQRTE